jgi:hypothetical protein
MPSEYVRSRRFVLVFFPRFSWVVIGFRPTHGSIGPIMALQTCSAVIVALCFGIAKGLVVHVEVATLYTIGVKISMPPYRPRPEPLASLARFNGAASWQRFMKEIGQYNCLFAFTSMGAQIDRSVNDGRGVPVFKICGQVHHRIGSLVPPDDGPPKFIQLYIYDTTNEIRNRLHSLDAEDSATQSLSPSIVNALMRMLDDHNPFVKKLRTARERLQEHPEEEFIIRIVVAREGDAVKYNLLTNR